MCGCDLSFKCVCAIWEGYILNPPARGWSSPSRRPLPLSPCRPVSLCRCVAVSPGHLFTPCHLVTLFTWSPGHLFTQSRVHVVRSPGHLVDWLRLCVFAPLRPSFALPCSPYSPAEKSIPCGKSLLVFILVSILTFPARFYTL